MTDTGVLREQAEAFRKDHQAILDQVARRIVGQDRVVDCTVTAILCGGNVLLEGVPGLGKTELIKSLAAALELKFQRVQFTPDLMPADITGTQVMTTDNQGHYQLEFRRGPVFTQILLADEINRATPKTQSALLETMQEKTVTAGGTTHHLEPPFFVLATQNPLEQEGTYPLPEAQLDRFLFKVVVPSMDRAGLNEVLARTVLQESPSVEKVVDGPRLLEMAAVLKQVVVADPLRDYAVRLVLATSPESEYAPDEVRQYVRCGASPRAAQALVQAARVRALAEGRGHVAAADVREYAGEVLQHRILRNYDGEAEDVYPQALVEAVVSHVPETLA